MNNVNDTKVVIVLFQYSIVAKGIEKKLSDQNFNVTTVDVDPEKIEMLTREHPLFLIHLSDEITDDEEEMNSLQELTNLIKENGCNMILIGEKRDHNELMLKLSVLDDYRWIDRPVDMDLLGRAIRNEIQGQNKPKEKKRILIVDDDPAYAKMVRAWIKDEYNIGVVTAGMQAITYLMKNKVDLILLDYEMPVVDGPQVLQMLRSEPELENIPVVFLTGVGTREEVARVMELKPNGYILKSTTKEDLIKSIKAQFAKL